MTTDQPKSEAKNLTGNRVPSSAWLGAIFLVIEDARYDDSSYVVAAYTTREAAAKKVERRERDDDGYSTYRVREVPLLGLPNTEAREPGPTT